MKTEVITVKLKAHTAWEVPINVDSIKLQGIVPSHICPKHENLPIPSDREIVCAALNNLIRIVNLGDVDEEITVEVTYGKWPLSRLAELYLHDGIYYKDGYIEDLIY